MSGYNLHTFFKARVQQWVPMMMIFIPTSTLLPIEILLNTIIKDYFITSYCVTILSDTPLTILKKPFIFIKADETKLVEKLLEVSEMGCSDYIVRTKRPEQFMSAFEVVTHKGQQRRSDRKIVILPYSEESGEDDMYLPAKVFAMKATSFVANVLIIVNVNNESDCKLFDLYTHRFVGPDNNNLPVNLDRWDSCLGKFEKQANLFPNNMVNMFGKKVKVACFTYKPYVFLDLDPAKVHLGRDGLEVRILEEFCRRINCTVEVVREDDNQWGMMNANRSGGVGIIGSVLADRADFGISGLYYWYEEYIELDFSAPLLRAGVTSLAPAPRLVSSWLTPLLPFRWKIWLAVLATYLYISGGLLVSYGCATRAHPFLTVFGVFIGQSIDVSKVPWRIRTVVVWLLTAGLVLSSAYGAGLASTFTVPRHEPSIDSIQDLVDRKMEWAATHDAWIFSLSQSTDPLIIQLVKQFRTYSPEEMERRSLARGTAFAIETLPAGHFAIGDYLNQEAVQGMMVMSQDFYYGQCVMMMRKSSPYTETVSQLVHRLHQGGLLLAWETQVASKHLNYKIQLEVKLSRSTSDVGSDKPLSLSNVVGIFIIYGGGILLSLVSLLAELYLHQRTKNQLIYLD